jgi:hypothetical protein
VKDAEFLRECFGILGTEVWYLAVFEAEHDHPVELLALADVTSQEMQTWSNRLVGRGGGSAGCDRALKGEATVDQRSKGVASRVDLVEARHIRLLELCPAGLLEKVELLAGRDVRGGGLANEALEQLDDLGDVGRRAPVLEVHLALDEQLFEVGETRLSAHDDADRRPLMPGEYALHFVCEGFGFLAGGRSLQHHHVALIGPAIGVGAAEAGGAELVSEDIDGIQDRGLDR